MVGIRTRKSTEGAIVVRVGGRADKFIDQLRNVRWVLDCCALVNRTIFAQSCKGCSGLVGATAVSGELAGRWIRSGPAKSGLSETNSSISTSDRASSSDLWNSPRRR